MNMKLLSRLPVPILGEILDLVFYIFFRHRILDELANWTEEVSTSVLRASILAIGLKKLSDSDLPSFSDQTLVTSIGGLALVNNFLQAGMVYYATQLFGPFFVVATDPKAVDHILRTNFDNYPKRNHQTCRRSIYSNRFPSDLSSLLRLCGIDYLSNIIPSLLTDPATYDCESMRDLIGHGVSHP